MDEESQNPSDLPNHDRLALANAALSALTDAVENCAWELSELSRNDAQYRSLAAQLNQLRNDHGRAMYQTLDLFAKIKTADARSIEQLQALVQDTQNSSDRLHDATTTTKRVLYYLGVGISLAGAILGFVL